MKLNLSTNACDAERLELFLSGYLSDAEEREFTRHLNTCECCRRALAEQAAEPEDWQEAKTLLKPSEFDAQCGGDVAELGLAERATRQPLQIQNVLDALGPTDDPEMLGRLGGYEISGVVGAGGMGVVLKAIDKSLDRTVAIKVLAPQLATSGAARKRFAREAKAAAAVIHPNVIAIHSVSNDEALPYLVMPYVRGTSLQKRLDGEGPLSPQEILRIGAQIAAGLAAAHAQGLVHRDIKPANILLEDGVERVTITDFGLARAVDDATITHSGMIAGTPQYMSPEQGRGEAVDARSDLFSLGSVLYAISTGRPPFRAETSYGVMRRITDDEPRPIRELNPDVPDWLCAIIARLMSKQASDRFASAAEVSELLEKCLAHVQQPAAVPLPAALVRPADSGRSCSISRSWVGVLAMIAALGLGLLGLFAWQATEAPDIAGTWTGQEWGDVVLKKTGDAEYAGTYSDTFGKQPGEIQLKWSRIEHRYYGTWREGDDRFGELSVRLVGDEIRGAHTTDPKSKINPATPRLADLAWTRSKGRRAQLKDGAFGPVFERVVRNREAIDFDTGDQSLIPDAELNPEKGLLWILEQRLDSLTDWMGEKKMDAISEGSCLIPFGLKVNELTNADWGTLDPAKLVDAVEVDWRRVNPRQFARAIDTIDPQAPPHVILALRGRQRTFAFQTREGGLGILQIMETTKEGFKIRFKLAANGETKRTSSVPRTTVIALKFAKAESAAKVLRTFVQENNHSARIVAEPVTNSLIVSAPEDEIRLIAALLLRLDVSAESSEPRSNPAKTESEEDAPNASDSSLKGDELRFSETKEVAARHSGRETAPLFIHFIGNNQDNSTVHLLTRRVGPTGGFEEEVEGPLPPISPLVLNPVPITQSAQSVKELTGRLEQRGEQYFADREYHLTRSDGYFKGEITLDKPTFPVFLAASSAIYPITFIVTQNSDPGPHLNQPFFKQGEKPPAVGAERATRIVGRITDPTGKPLAGQQIVAAVLPPPPKRSPRPGRRMEWKLAGEVPPSVTSDEEGRFTIDKADARATIMLQFHGAELLQPQKWKPKGSRETTISLTASEKKSELEVGYVPRNMTTKVNTVDGRATREVAITWSPTRIKVLWAYAPTIEKWKESRTLAEARDPRWKDGLLATDETVWVVPPGQYQYEEHNQHLNLGSALQLGASWGQGLRADSEKEIILFFGGLDPRMKLPAKP